MSKRRSAAAEPAAETAQPAAEQQKPGPVELSVNFEIWDRKTKRYVRLKGTGLRVRMRNLALAQRAIDSVEHLMRHPETWDQPFRPAS